MNKTKQCEGADEQRGEKGVGKHVPPLGGFLLRLQSLIFIRVRLIRRNSGRFAKNPE